MLRAKSKSIWQSSSFGWNGICGVYAVCTRELNPITYEYDPLKVWYIGATKNIGKRLSNTKHPYRLLWAKGHCAFIRYIETPDYVKLEKRLISLLNPPLNKQHKRLVVNVNIF